MIIEVQEMGSFKKKILINKVRQLDKAKMASGETPRSRPFKTREIHMAMKDEKAQQLYLKDRSKSDSGYSKGSCFVVPHDYPERSLQVHR